MNTGLEDINFRTSDIQVGDIVIPKDESGYKWMSTVFKVVGAVQNMYQVRDLNKGRIYTFLRWNLQKTGLSLKDTVMGGLVLAPIQNTCPSKFYFGRVSGFALDWIQSTDKGFSFQLRLHVAPLPPWPTGTLIITNTWIRANSTIHNRHKLPCLTQPPTF